MGAHQPFIGIAIGKAGPAPRPLLATARRSPVANGVLRTWISFTPSSPRRKRRPGQQIWRTIPWARQALDQARYRLRMSQHEKMLPKTMKIERFLGDQEAMEMARVCRRVCQAGGVVQTRALTT